jgi:hypothetical protein
MFNEKFNTGDMNQFNGDPLEYFDWKARLCELLIKSKLKFVLNPNAVETHLSKSAI